jgi:hypothetical protein
MQFGCSNRIARGHDSADTLSVRSVSSITLSQLPKKVIRLLQLLLWYVSLNDAPASWAPPPALRD